MRILRTEQKVKNNLPVIYKFMRDEHGQKIIEEDNTFVPYFYVKDPNGPYTTFDGQHASRIETIMPEDVREQREKYPVHYEADVRFPNRYIIDRVDKLELTPFKTLYFDIEVDNAGKMPRPEEARDTIVCLGMYDSMTDVYSTFVCRSDFIEGTQSEVFDDRLHEIHYYKTEPDMLAGFVKFMRIEQPDVITGWNLISFDMIYLLNRMLNLGMNIGSLSPINQAYTKGREAIIKGIALIDLMQAYRHLSENLEDSYTLDNIARKNVGEGKTEDSAQIRQLWKTDIERLIKYNIQDVRLTRLLDAKGRYIEFLDEIRRLCFCQLEETLTTTKTLDSFILHMFHDRIVFPTKIKHEEESQFEGGFVENWGRGIYENVAVFDLKSLYPSILVSLNLSPECIENGSSNSIEIDGVHIDQSHRGFLPEAIVELWKERAVYKSAMKKVQMDSPDYKLFDNRQKSVKVLLNAIYGQTAYTGSRFYEKRIAKTITFVGRKINEWSRNQISGMRHKVLYADTDSVFFLTLGKTIDEIKEICAKVNSSYSDFSKSLGVDRHNFEIEFQKIYRKIVFGTAKKRYSGHLIWKEGQTVDKIDSIGFEVRRSDSSKLTKNMQTRVFEMILKEDKSKDEVMRYIGDLIDKIRKGDYKLTEIGIPKGISKDLDDYGNKILLDDAGNIKHQSSVPVNVRAARYAEKVLNYQLSSKPKMVYITSLPPGLPTTFEGKPVDALCFDYEYQIPSGTVIDVETMLEKLVKAKLEAVFDAVGWKMSELDYHWKGKVGKVGKQQLFELGITDVGSHASLVDI